MQSRKTENPTKPQPEPIVVIPPAPTVTELAAIVLRIVDTLHLQDGQTKTWKPIRDEIEKIING